ncbi:MAG TPA: hypothetical protein VGK48_03550 [Terriglobia bacterium]
MGHSSHAADNDKFDLSLAQTVNESFKLTPGLWKVSVMDGKRELVRGQVIITP